MTGAENSRRGLGQGHWRVWEPSAASRFLRVKIDTKCNLWLGYYKLVLVSHFQSYSTCKACQCGVKGHAASVCLGTQTCVTNAWFWFNCMLTCKVWVERDCSGSQEYALYFTLLTEHNVDICHPSIIFISETPFHLLYKIHQSGTLLGIVLSIQCLLCFLYQIGQSLAKNFRSLGDE